MKKKILKRMVFILIPLVLFVVVVSGNPTTGDCNTETIFWGESCCTYGVTSETGATILMQKCCKYRVWIVWSCTTSYSGPI